MSDCLDDIVRIGGLKVFRDREGIATYVGRSQIYRKMGIITSVGEFNIQYDENKRVKCVGALKAKYDEN